MKAMTSLKSLKAADILLLIQILIFGVTIPTVDTYSDLVLCFNLYTSGHFLWAIATFLPVLICFTFTSVAFHKIPFTSPYHRYIGLPVLLLQVSHNINVTNNQIVNINLTGVAPIPLSFHRL